MRTHAPLVALALALLAAPLRAQDPVRLEGVFKLEGKDSVGDYRGDWSIAPVGTAVAVEADVRYDSGLREVRRGLGTLAGQRLSVVFDRIDRPRTPGILSSLYGELETPPPPPPATLEATYTVQAPTRLKGTLTLRDAAGAATRYGTETLSQTVRDTTLLVQSCAPNLLPRPSVFPIPVRVRGKGFPTTRILRAADVVFGDPGLVVREVLDQNPFGTEVTVAVDVTSAARIGGTSVRVAGSAPADLVEVAQVHRHVFVCLADGTSNGEPFDEYEGDSGVESFLRGGPRPARARSRGLTGAASAAFAKRKARGLSKELAGYQVIEAARYDTFVVLNNRKLFLVKFVWNRAELEQAFATKDAALVIDGHGHFGSGPTFNPPASPDEKFTMDASDPSADILTKPIRITDFYYNGCWSGAFFTSTLRAVMPGGRFFFNRMMASAWWTSRDFVRGIIEERRPEDVVRAMNNHAEGHQAGAAGFVVLSRPVGPDDPDNPNRTLLSVSSPEPNNEMAPRIFTPPPGWRRPR